MYIRSLQFTTTTKELSTDLSSFLCFSITDPLAQQHLYVLSRAIPGLSGNFTALYLFYQPAVTHNARFFFFFFF